MMYEFPLAEGWMRAVPAATDSAGNKAFTVAKVDTGEFFSAVIIPASIEVQEFFRDWMDRNQPSAA